MIEGRHGADHSDHNRHGMGVTPEALRAAGVERSLTKPVDPDELHAALAASLGSTRMR